MSFKVAARTVLELGAELISSDTIAIYELVKNAFDANSPNVELSFHIVIKRSGHQRILDSIDDERYASMEDAYRDLERQLVVPATIGPGLEFMDSLRSAQDLEELRDGLERVYPNFNFIRVRDHGTGMSMAILNEAFLTIGTPNRVLQRRLDPTARPKLGEKGVGRLSAMRLGSVLEVVTGRSGEPTWNELHIDWDDFARDPEALIGDVAVQAMVGWDKHADEQGTTRGITKKGGQQFS